MHPLAVLLAAIAIACAGIAAADTSADQAALRELKEVYWPKAHFEQNTKLLERILAPEFQMVDGDGNWSTKTEYQSTNVLIKRGGQWRAIASHVSGYRKIS